MVLINTHGHLLINQSITFPINQSAAWSDVQTRRHKGKGVGFFSTFPLQSILRKQKTCFPYKSLLLEKLAARNLFPFPSFFQLGFFSKMITHEKKKPSLVLPSLFLTWHIYVALLQPSNYRRRWTGGAAPGSCLCTRREKQLSHTRGRSLSLSATPAPSLCLRPVALLCLGG